ncbi:hypothetical protein E2C01_048694 [Portunus trituberculatus]|uniref:Uncharacterized protein n=1 Tax=Portunus trituberculatus TaxID=210409 RepID=A0A5B7GAV5_PORTR|nr:hypothetical protein [Portunus trituberculatus]
MGHQGGETVTLGDANEWFLLRPVPPCPLRLATSGGSLDQHCPTSLLSLFLPLVPFALLLPPTRPPFPTHLTLLSPHLPLSPPTPHPSSPQQHSPKPSRHRQPSSRPPAARRHCSSSGDRLRHLSYNLQHREAITALESLRSTFYS